MNERLLDRLPHAPPFRLLDRVLWLAPGEAVIALKEIAAGDPFADGTGEWPAVLLAEAMAQAAGLAAAPEADGAAAVVAGFDRVRIRGGTRIGDRLLVVARVRRRFGATAMVRCAARTARQRRAAAEIVLRFG